jgi:hypothetical protein
VLGVHVYPPPRNTPVFYSNSTDQIRKQQQYHFQPRLSTAQSTTRVPPSSLDARAPLIPRSVRHLAQPFCCESILRGLVQQKQTMLSHYRNCSSGQRAQSKILDECVRHDIQFLPSCQRTINNYCMPSTLSEGSSNSKFRPLAPMLEGSEEGQWISGLGENCGSCRKY